MGTVQTLCRDGAPPKPRCAWPVPPVRRRRAVAAGRLSAYRLPMQAHRRALPLIGDLPAFRSDRLGFLTRLAREHGDVAAFRIGPYRIWQLAHPEDVAEVLGAAAGTFRKGPVLQRARLVLGDGLLTAEGDVHRRHRRLLASAFHPRRVAGYADVMVARTLESAARLRPGEPVDVHAEAVRTTLAVAGETLLGTDVDADVDAVEGAIADLLSAYALAFVPFGWRLTNLPVGPMRRLARGRATLHRIVERMVARARDRGGQDLLSALVHDRSDRRLSGDELRDEAVTLLLAGHETTANALAFAYHLMATHPDVERRVHAEVDGVLAGRPPGTDDVDRLPTCTGLIAEALRLYPPSWSMGRQALVEHPVREHVVAAGDLVLLPQWVVHRDPRWWPEPRRCEPDRWADGAVRRRRAAYFPFGGGARRCIGEGFAWTEGVLALATMAGRWRLLPDPGRPLRLEPVITLRPRGGLWMRPVPRGASGQPRR